MNYGIKRKKSSLDKNSKELKDEKDIHKRYTVMLAMYMKDKNSKPLYFYGDEYGELYPSDKRIKAIIGGDQKLIILLRLMLTCNTMS